MNSRLMDVLVLLTIIGMSTYLYQRTHPSAAPPPPPSPAVCTPGGPCNPPARPARKAPAFRLPQLDGSVFEYPGGTGPIFITLSAVGCGDCQTRVPTDRKAVELARSRGWAVWNICVFANPEGGQAFKDRFQPEADQFLCDPSPNADVAVGKLGGSDATCWILIGPEGTIDWQGGPDLETLDRHLTPQAQPACPGQAVEGVDSVTPHP